jgi:hypothetical protein
MSGFAVLPADVFSIFLYEDIDTLACVMRDNNEKMLVNHCFPFALVRLQN